jgi:hypothetical protein
LEAVASRESGSKAEEDHAGAAPDAKRPRLEGVALEHEVASSHGDGGKGEVNEGEADEGGDKDEVSEGEADEGGDKGKYLSINIVKVCEGIIAKKGAAAAETIWKKVFAVACKNLKSGEPGVATVPGGVQEWLDEAIAELPTPDPRCSPDDEKSVDNAMLSFEWVCTCISSAHYINHKPAEELIMDYFLMRYKKSEDFVWTCLDERKFNGIVENIKGLIRKSDWFPQWSSGRLGSKVIMRRLGAAQKRPSSKKRQPEAASSAGQPKPEVASSSAGVPKPEAASAGVPGAASAGVPGAASAGVPGAASAGQPKPEVASSAGVPGAASAGVPGAASIASKSKPKAPSSKSKPKAPPSKKTPAAASAPKPAPGDKGYLPKATRAKYRQELEKRERRVGNDFKGIPLTDDEWNFKFQALVDNLPFLSEQERANAEEQLRKFKADAGEYQVVVQWPPP